MRSSNHQYLGGSSEGDEKVMMGGEGGKGNKGKEPGGEEKIKDEAGYTNLKKSTQVGGRSIRTRVLNNNIRVDHTD